MNPGSGTADDPLMRKALGYPVLSLGGSSQELEAASPWLFEAGCLGTEDLGARGKNPKSKLEQRAFFPPGTHLAKVAAILRLRVPRLLVSPPTVLKEEDWLAKWRERFSTVALGKRFLVVPSWVTPPATDRSILRIDPERAFGTGTHESTRLALELLERIPHCSGAALDVGTGTGILAMAAARLGFDPVVGLDNDPEASSCSRANVIRNGLAETVTVRVEDFRRTRLPSARVVLANLSQSLLEGNLPILTQSLLPGGSLILSGLLVSQVPGVLGAFPSILAPVGERRSGEWAALLASLKE